MGLFDNIRSGIGSLASEVSPRNTAADMAMIEYNDELRKENAARWAQAHNTAQWGSLEPIANYVAQRKSAQQQIIGFTDALVSVFTTNSALVKRLRPLGLRGLQRLQKTKQRVGRVMVGS